MFCPCQPPTGVGLIGKTQNLPDFALGSTHFEWKTHDLPDFAATSEQ
jgi:hypothetical protein